MAKRRGRPDFVPTAAQRKVVSDLAGYGIPINDICLMVINPETGSFIDTKTLRKYFDLELKQAKVQKIGKVAGNLFKIATSPRREAVPAAIFFLKTQAGWKETQRFEHTDADGNPLYTPTLKDLYDMSQQEEPNGDS